MIKKIKYILPLILLFSIPSAVLAEDENITTGDRSVRVRIENKINTVKDNIQENKEIRIENREERREEFAKKHAERLSKRFAEYYDRLSKIINKIETRVIDNEKAKEKLSEAGSKLEEAKKLGEEAVQMFESLTFDNLGSNNDEVEAAKNKVTATRKAFIESHKLVRDVIKILKEQ